MERELSKEEEELLLAALKDGHITVIESPKEAKHIKAGEECFGKKNHRACAYYLGAVDDLEEAGLVRMLVACDDTTYELTREGYKVADKLAEIRQP